MFTSPDVVIVRMPSIKPVSFFGNGKGSHLYCPNGKLFAFIFGAVFQNGYSVLIYFPVCFTEGLIR